MTLPSQHQQLDELDLDIFCCGSQRLRELDHKRATAERDRQRNAHQKKGGA